MAVFPERIVLKSSTDGDSAVQLEIGATGPSPILPGELVVSRGSGTVNLYAVDADGNIVSASVPSLSGLNDVDLDDYSSIPDASIIAFNASTQKWENVVAPPYDVSGNILNDLGDVNIGADTVLVDEAVLSWDNASSRWVNRNLTIEGLLTSDPPSSIEDGSVLRYSTESSTEFAGDVGWEVTFLEYTDITGRPVSLSDLNADLSLNDLVDVNLTGPDIGDLIAWDGSVWSTINAPPVDLSNGTLSQLGDVTEVTVTNGSVPVYNASNSKYEIKKLEYNFISNAPTAISDFSNDVGVSYWTNDAGYITATDGLDTGSLEDVTITNPLEGQMLLYRSGFWVNEYGPPANISQSGIGELKDVTYLQPGSQQGVLTVENMGELRFDSPASGSGYTQQLVYDIEYGLGMTFLRDIDSSGSAVYVERGRGVTLRADVNIVRLSGRPNTTSNRPELRFETGDSGADVGTGEYISLKMPATVDESVVYYLPSGDGDVGDILATDGVGNLSWIAQSSNGSLGDLSDVDLVTIPPSDGEGLVYNLAGGVWIPGAVSNVDLSSQSINALGDVDTATTPPQDGEGLIYYSATGLWGPGTVSDVDLSSESINALSDVNTSSPDYAPTDGQVLAWDESLGLWVPSDSAGGGGGGASDLTLDNKTTSLGYATFDAIGKSGVLVEIGCDTDAWITFYPTAALRAADQGRLFNTDPIPGSGVLSEAYIEAGEFVLATPGTVYFNNDFPTDDAIYVSARTAEGALIDGANIVVSAYPGVSGTSSGTLFSLSMLKSVVAASSDFSDFQSRIAAL